jgi:hypothetical protein
MHQLSQNLQLGTTIFEEYLEENESVSGKNPPAKSSFGPSRLTTIIQIRAAADIVIPQYRRDGG